MNHPSPHREQQAKLRAHYVGMFKRLHETDPDSTWETLTARCATIATANGIAPCVVRRWAAEGGFIMGGKPRGGTKIEPPQGTANPWRRRSSTGV